MVPVTIVLVVPLLYAAWLRRKYRMDAINDPGHHVSDAIKRAMKHKDIATAIFLLSFPIAASIGGLGLSITYWLPPAAIAAVAFAIRFVLEGRIRKEIGQ